MIAEEKIAEISYSTLCPSRQLQLSRKAFADERAENLFEAYLTAL
jgi:hypothetical protein